MTRRTAYKSSCRTLSDLPLMNPGDEMCICGHVDPWHEHGGVCHIAACSCKLYRWVAHSLGDYIAPSASGVSKEEGQP